MRRVTAIIAAGLVCLAPAFAFAQHHPDGRGRDGHAQGQGGRGGGAPMNHPQGGGRGGPPAGPYRGPPQGPYRGPVQGPGGRGGSYAPSGRGRVSLDGVISQIHRRYPGGRMLDAGVENWNGRSVYRVRWSTGDGRRVDYLVDTQTGEIVGKED